MAVRSTILIFGDENVAGTQTKASLNAIDPTYDEEQTDGYIWNINTQAWELMHPGVNTNTQDPGSDKWSIEARAREGLRAQVPVGDVYFIKFAAIDSMLTFTDLSKNLDGSAGVGDLKPCWFPSARDTTAYSGMMAEIKAAAAKADTDAGDTLSIDGIEICLFLEDIQNITGWRSYQQKMRELIDALRIDLFAAFPFVTTGSIRNDGGLTPVAIVGPHAEFSGLSVLQKAIALSIRGQIEQLANETDRVSVFSTQTLTTSDGEHFDAGSLVSLGFDVQAGLFPYVQISDTDFDEAPIGLLIGDSIVDGIGGTAAPPDHLQAPIAGVEVFNPHTGNLETLEWGVNNSLTGGNITGPELSLGEQFRAEFGEFWMVKGAQSGAYCVTNREPALSPVPPTYDIWRKDWDIGTRRGLYDLTVRTWLKETVLQLRKRNKRPRMKSIMIHLGTNDILLPVSQLFPHEPGEVVPSLKRMVAFLRRDIAVMNIVDADPVDVIIIMPAQYLDAVNAYTKASVEIVRTDMQAWALEDRTIKLLDSTNYSTLEGLHWDTAGAIAFAKDAFQVWKGEPDATAQPLFTPLKNHFKRALRLSEVPLTNDATVMIDQAISSGNARIYNALGTAIVDSLLEMPYATTPQTDDERLRALAATTEIKIVRVELLRVMPLMFKDGSSAVQSWNEEAAFREGGYLQTRDEIRRLETEITQNLTFLISGATASKGSLITPDSIIPPGSTIHGDVV